MPELVLLRHGQSLWNQEGRFTGWTDIDLSEKGIEEARNAGRLLKANGYSFDVAYTSVLKRAIRTLWIVQDEMDLMWIPVSPPGGLTNEIMVLSRGATKKRWKADMEPKRPKSGAEDTTKSRLLSSQKTIVILRKIQGTKC